MTLKPMTTSDKYNMIFGAISIALTILAIIVVPYFSSLKDDFVKYQKDSAAFKLEIAKDYVTKDDMKEHVSTKLESIEGQINTIHSLLLKQEGN